jgi:hypothetical protein
LLFFQIIIARFEIYAAHFQFFLHVFIALFTLITAQMAILYCTDFQALVLSKKWNVSIVHLWLDSQIPLHWIISSHLQWLPFVANRVKKIHKKQGSAIWDYINTVNNPADLLSRGINPKELKTKSLWWHGPTFLSENIAPFSREVNFKPSKLQPPEVRQSRKVLICSLTFKSSFIENFSNYSKLIRITAWCLRFCWNAHWFGPLLSGPLQTFELNQALTSLIKIVQREHFNTEFKRLNQGLNVEPASRLASLNPFIDALGIIRVGGRLQNAHLSFEQKFQIVLPGSCTFTRLLIRYEHIRHAHSSIQAMRSILRRQYWILRQDSAIQYCIIKCVKCVRIKADTKQQMMASLPKARVVPGKVFQTVGIDYAGPFNLLVNQGRGRHRVTQKAYVAIFVCFKIKAIHLELVSDATTVTFLAAFDRFVGRRGLPEDVWSDNGPNFVGADNRLKELFDMFKKNQDEITSHLAMKGCSWDFNPPHGSSFGGLWEAGVKSVKKHLTVVIGETLFTYEQYETLLIKIEACLNSRPLILESSDPNDPGALTPGHFLIGGPLTAVPNPDITNVPINRLKYWELVTRKMQEFWSRWRNDYLNTLQQRSKWRQGKYEIKVNDVVIVKEDKVPPLNWPLAIITAVHPGKDNLVRVVTVRMALNQDANSKPKEYRRPVSKLVYLPVDEE